MYEGREQSITVGSVLAHAVVRLAEPVEAMHQVIAGGWFRKLAPVSRPVQLAHDTIASLVYGSIRVGSAIGGAVIDARAEDPEEQASAVQAMVKGLWGDVLESADAGMSIRDAAGERLSVSPASATSRIVVLVHGLMETERRWSGTPDRPGFLEALAARHDLTAITVRYNSGLAVAANGAHLADLLDGLVARWPVPVESMALVGHSMGGLVVREACLSAESSGKQWLSRCTDLVTIGTPHAGAPLEGVAEAVAGGLIAIPVSRPLGRFLEGRSRGIKDLGMRRPAGNDLAPHIRQHFMAGVVTADPSHPISSMVGDLMVRPSSGTGGVLEPDNSEVRGGLRHFDLLHDQGVIGRVLGWITTE